MLCGNQPDAASMARRHEILISAQVVPAARRRSDRREAAPSSTPWMGSTTTRLRCATRMDQTADSGGHNTGFRCARDVAEEDEL